MQLEAYFYDGQTSRRTACVLEIGSSGYFKLPNDLQWQWQQLKVSPRIGNTPRFLDLPDGSRLESSQNDLIDQLCEQFNPEAHKRAGLIHTLESKLRYALAAVVITGLMIWWFVAAGLPAIADQVAQRLPISITQELGAETLAVLDQSGLFSDSQLPEGQQQAIRQQFRQIAESQTSAFNYRLHFRDGGIMGPNALALPSGDILITDQLIELADHPQGIQGVLAHEVGHVEHRHSLRMILQSSTYPLIITAVTGDMSAATTVLAALPTLLVEKSYSRRFEEEADQFAIDYMRQENMDVKHLATLLTQLENNIKRSNIPDWFSSHPATERRVQMLEDAKQSH
ncbi:M48 family metallopeptidase [Pontibacterium sp.]|uniref:M48 family metallopeptidase n=1 Tax=Pontibacterium sp. TaxID=2036026 RepID=UPI003567D850